MVKNPNWWEANQEADQLVSCHNLKDGIYFCYGAYTVRSAYLEILGFPMVGAY